MRGSFSLCQLYGIIFSNYNNINEDTFMAITDKPETQIIINALHDSLSKMSTSIMQYIHSQITTLRPEIDTTNPPPLYNRLVTFYLQDKKEEGRKFCRQMQVGYLRSRSQSQLLSKTCAETRPRAQSCKNLNSFFAERRPPVFHQRNDQQSTALLAFGPDYEAPEDDSEPDWKDHLIIEILGKHLQDPKILVRSYLIAIIKHYVEKQSEPQDEDAKKFYALMTMAHHLIELQMSFETIYNPQKNHQEVLLQVTALKCTANKLLLLAKDISCAKTAGQIYGAIANILLAAGDFEARLKQATPEDVVARHALPC
jgi:hypothetical protein